jgi:hypothetical protein
MARAIPNTKPDPTPEEVEVVAAEPIEPEVVEVEPEAEEPEPEPEPEPEDPTERHEKFEATRPDGTVVVVDRNIDTGVQTVTDK